MVRWPPMVPDRTLRSFRSKGKGISPPNSRTWTTSRRLRFSDSDIVKLPRSEGDQEVINTGSNKSDVARRENPFRRVFLLPSPVRFSLEVMGVLEHLDRLT